MLGRGVIDLLQVSLGFRQFGHVELQGGIFGQFGDGIKINFHPFVDFGYAAVGDDAQTNLPFVEGPQAFAFDKLK